MSASSVVLATRGCTFCCASAAAHVRVYIRWCSPAIIYSRAAVCAREAGGERTSDHHEYRLSSSTLLLKLRTAAVRE